MSHSHYHSTWLGQKTVGVRSYARRASTGCIRGRTSEYLGEETALIPRLQNFICQLKRHRRKTQNFRLDIVNRSVSQHRLLIGVLYLAWSASPIKIMNRIHHLFFHPFYITTMQHHMPNFSAKDAFLAPTSRRGSADIPSSKKTT